MILACRGTTRPMNEKVNRWNLIRGNSPGISLDTRSKSLLGGRRPAGHGRSARTRFAHPVPRASPACAGPGFVLASRGRPARVSLPLPTRFRNDRLSTTDGPEDG